MPIGASAALFATTPPAVPARWTVTGSRWIDQMVRERVETTVQTAFLELRQEDVPDMLSLAAATEPGPFDKATNRTGRYRGIRSANGQLVAMAGERRKLDGYTEISAVCTAPEFRGQGLGRTLVTAMASMLLSERRIPFLHVKTENGAKRLYEQIGFRVRREIRLTVITRLF